MKQPIIAILLFFLFIMPVSGEYPKAYIVPPKTPELLFYIHRNHNRNTIVYDANFDNDGYLIEDDPIDVYWIRYEEEGQRMELRSIEKMFAYGETCKKIDSLENQFEVTLIADKEREFRLIQKAPFEAGIYMLINQDTSLLDHLYIYADNSGVWPKVKYIELFGKGIITHENTYEKVLN
jgi:hypothetical protein